MNPTPAGPPRPVRLNIEHPKGTQTILAGAHAASSPLSAILRRNGLPLNTRCGQRGLCDGCMVELTAGSLRHLSTGQIIRAGGEPIALHGCQHGVNAGDAEVGIRIPARSLLAHEPQVVSEFKINVPWANNPLIAADADGPGNEPDRMVLGVAVDVGTTTVAVLLVDLATGKIIGRAAGFNRQMHLGDDVVTRINLCSTDPAMLGQLQAEVVAHTIAPLLAEALRSNGLMEIDGDSPAASADSKAPGVRPPRIAGFTIAGNTTMLHLLAGVDPRTLGFAPFTPVFLDHRIIHGEQIGLKLPRGISHPRIPRSPDAASPPIHLLPGAAAYIGADLVAGILSSGLIYDDGPSLLVDVGTNGEIILKHGPRILGCATAAGPAFEGAKLASGIRAGRGAISDIRITKTPFAIHTEVIGGGQPIGLCGSAYIDFLAEARRAGLLTPTGRFAPAPAPGFGPLSPRERAGVRASSPPAAGFPPAARPHLIDHDGHTAAFRIADGKGRHPLIITEVDIASLLQAKAAIAAGILTLLDQAGLRPEHVQRLYLAGGFGTHMDHRNAIDCGLLPGFRPDQVQVVGNSSLAGAYLAMVDASALDEMTRLARRVQIVELNLVPQFEERYIEQLALP